MDGAAAASSLGVLLQILLLDLLLSGDNALVIALACRRLPQEQARRAAWLGAAGAIGFRLILTLMTGALMKLPFLQLLSALPLLVIALNMMADQEEPNAPRAEADSMAAVAGLIIVSDAAMSLDNVVALAAVSHGNFWLLAFGLGLTIPLIVFGSFGFSALMKAYPVLVDLGGALLGWVAGGMIVSDPLFAGFVERQAPALGLALPLACGIFVLVQGRFAREGAAEAPKPADAPRAAQPVLAVQTIAPKALAPKSEAAAPVILSPAPVEVRAEAVKTDAAEPDAETALGDRWMIFGLLGLFAIFGLFLTLVVAIPD